ncbi:MAG: hypothetical protein JO256_00140 [Alphaproteobacteria bacterium]|nr:hypothetical protein [Alphaproteobacteria bacterium]
MARVNQGRRNLLKMAGAAPVLGLPCATAQGSLQVAILTQSGDAVAMSVPAQWAAGELEKALTARNVNVSRAAAANAVTISLKTDSALPAEGFRLAPAGGGIAVSAADPRGFVYALLELAERAKFGSDPRAALTIARAETAAPATRIRSITRVFSDEPHDKPWLWDRAFWPAYLDLMAASRFNRFALTLGLAYDFPTGVTGDYLHFAYPYLVSVPGYPDVRVEPLLPPGEQQKNWDALRFIAQECAKRALNFQLGIWTHAYAWTDSPKADHRIAGLTPQNHAQYCRDALVMILRGNPEITGVSMRIHGESGIPEGSYDFWQTVFDAFPLVGRRLDLDMHAKGLNQTMIDMAHKTGMRVTAGPKYSAEHQSLGYHQADIRAQEIPRPDASNTGTFAVSNGARSFTRYGYADMYQDGANLGLVYRLWPGTQRHLLKGDAALAAAMARSASFCGAEGLEIMEPLTFKGREGSSQPGTRNAYLDQSLEPKEGDFAKFEISYRQWGRTLYDPNTRPDAWRRSQRAKLGAGSDAAQDALAYATRILALLTSAHLPSASNHELWYEMHWNQGLLPDGTPYRDNPQPHVFGSSTALDPQTFSSIYEHADDMLAGRANCKYSPVEVANWVDQLVASAKASLAVAVAKTPKPSADFRRLDEDVRIQIGTGEFFAAKLRAALLFSLFELTHDPKAGQAAVAQYEKARAAWAAFADRAKLIYRADVAYGRTPFRRGHWSDRLERMDADIAAVKAAVAKPAAGVGRDAAALIAAVMSKPMRPQMAVVHTAPERFQPSSDLVLTAKAAADVTAILHYRHVDQAERWTEMRMTGSGGTFTATIPAAYTASPYPLQYYFEFRRGGRAWSHPAFNASLSNVPYYAVFKRS